MESRLKINSPKSTRVTATMDPSRTDFRFNYPSELRRRLISEPFASKGQRTRFSLKVAAAFVIEKVGYQDCTVSAICKRARVSQGTFYVYFKDKSDIVESILLDFLEYIYAKASTLAHGADDFDVLMVTNCFFVDVYQRNPGLIRSLFQFDDADPAFREKNREIRREWTAKIARSIRRRSLPMELPNDISLYMAYALETMVYQYLYDIFVRKVPTLSDLAKDPRYLAELLSVLWYRAVFCREPPVERMSLTYSMSRARP